MSVTGQETQELTATRRVPRPEVVVWDLTYACPLRCSHCYSESGRRPSRQLEHADMLRLAEALVSLGPRVVAFSGGEPMLVPRIAEPARLLADAGIRTSINTSGWVTNRRLIGTVAETFDEVLVSLDGATAEVHDRIRGRAGSFARVMKTLGILDELAADRAARGRPRLWFGTDCVVVRTNFGHLERFATEIAPRFPRLCFLSFNAVVPEGLASRREFEEHELLEEAQAARLTDERTRARLRELAPDSVQVFTLDNLDLMMRPDQPTHRERIPLMLLEPDGEVRGIPVYEGTVGNLLHEPAAEVWQRSVARWDDPFVLSVLAGIRTRREWGEAVRTLDLHFGSDDVRARIARRSVRFDPPEFAGHLGPSLPHRTVNRTA
ncbi:radical SAM protein [Streptomyces sp. NPDC005728]|uniref:radical SAM protein n=1 Tax=Streptomyces sp. NPDC005728 TaxID=3157054 RepID=UPI0033D62B4F